MYSHSKILQTWDSEEYKNNLYLFVFLGKLFTSRTPSC